MNIPGYNVIRCDAKNRSTGKVVLFVRDDIRYETILTKKLESNCWCAAIEIKDKLCKGVIMVIYHLSSAFDRDFVDFMEDIVEELIVKGECSSKRL